MGSGPRTQQDMYASYMGESHEKPQKGSAMRSLPFLSLALLAC